MSSNTASPAVLAAWFDSLSAERQAAIGDPTESEENFLKALDAFEASQGGTATESKKTAKPYRVLLLNMTAGTFEDHGTHLGSRGRPATDPRHYSPLQKVTSRLEMQAIRAAKGENPVKLEIVELPVEV